MKLGISTFAYAWSIGVGKTKPQNPMTALDFLKRAKALRLHRVQFGDNLPLHECAEEELVPLIDFASREAIQVEVGARGLVPDHLHRYVTIAERFQSPFLRMVIDGKHYEPSVDEVVKVIQEIVPTLKEKNIKLAIENHDRFTAKKFVEMVERTDPEWVGICLDTINSMGADQSIGEILPHLAPLTLNLHVKDYTITRKWHNMGFDTVGTPAGKGMMPIKEIIGVLENYGKCYSATLELWPPPEDDIEATVKKENRWVEESLTYLKTFLQ